MSLLVFFKQFFVKNNSYNFLERRFNVLIDRSVITEMNIDRVAVFNVDIINRG